MKNSVLLLKGMSGTPSRITLDGRIQTLGRSEHADIVLRDESVSRLHAAIESRGDGYWLVDRDSRNGTRVNGVCVMRRRLNDGDRIHCGNVALTFHEVDEDASEPSVLEALPPEDEDSARDPTGATRCFTVDGSAGAMDIEPLNAWQILRSCASSRAGDMRDVFHALAQNLATAFSVRRVVIHLQPGIIDGKAQWFKGGSAHGKAGVCLPEERLLEVARTGLGVGVLAGTAAPLVPDRVYDALCAPVRVRGVSAGFLYAEAEDVLAKEATRLMTGATEAIGVAIGIWSLARQERSPEKTPSASSVSIIGCSPALQNIMRLAVRAAASESTVLIRGESGTGKELFARLIYAESKRATQPFLPVHCSAIEETLLGSTLFGHERGAFTGAVGLKKGLFEEATHGTIFLDEIGELTLSMQVKLLRVLQEGEFMRIGGTKPILVNVRVIAATNRDLEKAVRDGLFREDLYFRLKVIDLRLPPLRERREDIQELIHHFVEELRRATASRVRDITPEAMDVLKQHHWPGNVRELRNVIERCLVLAEGPSLTVDDLPADIVMACPPEQEASAEGAPAQRPDLEAAKRQHILRVLKQCGGNKRMAAQRLGISRSTLYTSLEPEQPR